MTTIHEFKQVTDKLGIFPNELGAVMLDFEPIDNLTAIIPEEWLYYSPNQEQWWIKGWVANKAHLTLKYGLLQKAYELKDEIAKLTEGLSLPQVRVAYATTFQDPGNPYTTIVLALEDDPALLEFNRRLSYLPHVDTYTPWVPHVTVAYIHSGFVTPAVERVHNMMTGRILIPRGLNLGEDKSEY